MVQALHYGSPQDRKRTIFLAAKRGEKLPSYPMPTHAAPPHTRKVNEVTLESVRRSTHDPKGYGAPFRSIVTEDVLTDLVRFPSQDVHYIVLTGSFSSPNLNGINSSNSVLLTAHQD
jgi:DNA (cytosine-5)-methyltransferase 1